MWIFEFTGPESSLYEGGLYELQIELPMAYPLESPLITMVTKIWHPNFDPKSGELEQSILRKISTSNYSLAQILEAIISLLKTPIFDYANKSLTFRNENSRDFVYCQYFKNFQRFKKRAADWKEKYAFSKYSLDPNTRKKRGFSFEMENSTIVSNSSDDIMLNGNSFDVIVEDGLPLAY